MRNTKKKQLKNKKVIPADKSQEIKFIDVRYMKLQFVRAPINKSLKPNMVI